MTKCGGRELLEYFVDSKDLAGSANWVERAAEDVMHQVCGRTGGELGLPTADAVAEPLATDEPIGLTVVVVRGLQGSGKSTLCRALRALLGGQWVNQDEVVAAAGGKRRGSSARELFLHAVSAAAADAQTRYLFVDKIHTLRRHRDDVRDAIARGLPQRQPSAGRAALVLLNLAHPDDDEGEHMHAEKICVERIGQRGVCHLSLVPQATNPIGVVAGTGQSAEAPGDEEKCLFDFYCNIDMRLSAEQLVGSALVKLAAAQLLASDHMTVDSLPADKLCDAVRAARAYERELRSHWKTLYWCVKLRWADVLWGLGSHEAKDDAARSGLRHVVAKCFDGVKGLEPVDDPHVTLLWLGREDVGEAALELDSRLSELEGNSVRVEVTAVCVDRSLGLVALRVTLDPKVSHLCTNVHPHITSAKRPEVAAVCSNEMLQRQFEGDAGVDQTELSLRVVLEGTVARQLAPECVALVAGGGALPEVGNPICELGLAATTEAVDIWATHDASMRWHRIHRAFRDLYCLVSEPLLFCKGWPPKLRGKVWITLHERPLQAKSVSVLRDLERHGQLQTVHIGAAYFEVPNLLTAASCFEMQVRLEQRLSGQGARALSSALDMWRIVRAIELGGSTSTACEREELVPSEVGTKPRFYVNAKSVGASGQTRLFRQALAAAVATLTGWEPVIIDADITLAASVKEDWVLLGLQLPRIAASSAASTGGSGITGGRCTLGDDSRGGSMATPMQASSVAVGDADTRYLISNMSLLPLGTVADSATLAALGRKARNALCDGVRKQLITECRASGQMIEGLVEVDGRHLEGGGQLLRSALAYSAVFGRPVHVFDVRGGRSPPGLRQAHAAAVGAIVRLAEARVVGGEVKSSRVTLIPGVGGVGGLTSPPVSPLVVDAGTGGSTMLMFQAALPVMLARSAAMGGTEVVATFQGGTNVAPSSRSKGPFALNAPQVDYVKLVLLPTLQRLFGVSLELRLQRRGFANGGGEVEVRAVAPHWPLRAFELTDRGEVARARGMAYSSAGIPKHVLGRMIEAHTKKKAAGAAVHVKARFPNVPTEWEQEEVESVDGAEACGIIVILETVSGCLLVGDSMGRTGAPAEKVGDEAAHAAIEAFDNGGCVDQHLADQLIIFMALARGTSRLRVGKGEFTLHARTALWLANIFGAESRLLQDEFGQVLEVDGVGSSFVAS